MGGTAVVGHVTESVKLWCVNGGTAVVGHVLEELKV